MFTLLSVTSVLIQTYPWFIFLTFLNFSTTGSHRSDHQSQTQLQRSWSRGIFIILSSNASISYTNYHRLPTPIFPSSVHWHSSAIAVGLPSSSCKRRSLFSSKPYTSTTTASSVPIASPTKDTTSDEQTSRWNRSFAQSSTSRHAIATITRLLYSKKTRCFGRWAAWIGSGANRPHATPYSRITRDGWNGGKCHTNIDRYIII